MVLFVWIFVMLILSGNFVMKKKFDERYSPVYQKIVNQYRTMKVSELQTIIVRQFDFFLKKNKKTPFVIKYNMVFLLPIYTFLTIIQIIPLKISIFTVICSVIFFYLLSLSIAETYMYYRITEEYIELFWESYLVDNKSNGLMVISRYSYTPKEKILLLTMWYATFSSMALLIFSHIASIWVWGR